MGFLRSLSREVSPCRCGCYKYPHATSALAGARGAWMRNYKNEAIRVISLDSVTIWLLASEGSHGSRRPGAPSRPLYGGLAVLQVRERTDVTYLAWVLSVERSEFHPALSLVPGACGSSSPCSRGLLRGPYRLLSFRASCEDPTFCTGVRAAGSGVPPQLTCLGSQEAGPAVGTLGLGSQAEPVPGGWCSAATSRLPRRVPCKLVFPVTRKPSDKAVPPLMGAGMKS